MPIDFEAGRCDLVRETYRRYRVIAASVENERQARANLARFGIAYKR